MLKGLGGIGDMAKMMKAAQDMQAKMAELQEDLDTHRRGRRIRRRSGEGAAARPRAR